MRRRSATSNRPIAEAMTTAASALGEFAVADRAPAGGECHGQRADDAGQLRPRSRGFRYRSARRAAADGKPLEKSGGEVDGRSNHFLIRIDRLAKPRGVRTRQDAGVGERHERRREAAESYRRQVLDADRRYGKRRQSERKGAEH